VDFKSIFSKPANGADIDKLLSYQLLWMMLLRLVLYTSILGISYFFKSDQYKLIVLPKDLSILFLLLVYFTTIGSSYFLTAHKFNPRHFGFIQYLLDTIFASILVFYTGASQSIFSSVYFFPIIAGGLLLPKKGGLIAAAAATILYGLTLSLEYHGIYPSYLLEYNFVPDQDFIVGLNRFSVKGLTFFLAAILSILFANRLKSTEAALSDTIKSYDILSLRYKDIFDHIATGIITVNRDEIITSANNATTMITGYPVDVLIGTKFSTFLPNFNLNKINTRLAANLVRKDGVKIRIGYSNTLLHHPTDNLDQDNRQLLLTDDYKIVTIQDISEIERLENQMRQSEKLAAIGRMSASIAHDFRNPLTAISGSAQLLATEFSLNRTACDKADIELVDIISRESNRLIHTIADFLRFARPESAVRNWFSLKSCLDEVMQVCYADPAWPPTCVVNQTFDDNIYLWADRGQIFTILSQLIQNGVAMCPEGMEYLDIEAEEIGIDIGYAEVVLRVSDNGLGISEEDRLKIFEPFYTTRPEGTGLGLAIVKQMIEEHKGQIEVERSAMGGAMFVLHLPLPTTQ